MIHTVLTTRPATINISISLSISFLLPLGHDNNKTRLINLSTFERGNVFFYGNIRLKYLKITSPETILYKMKQGLFILLLFYGTWSKLLKHTNTHTHTYSTYGAQGLTLKDSTLFHFPSHVVLCVAWKTLRLCFGARGFLCAAWRHREAVLEHGGCLLLVLRCYSFTKSWMVLPADGEARGPRPASGLSASSKLRREDQSEARESDFKTGVQF